MIPSISELSKCWPWLSQCHWADPSQEQVTDEQTTRAQYFILHFIQLWGGWDLVTVTDQHLLLSGSWSAWVGPVSSIPKLKLCVHVLQIYLNLYCVFVCKPTLQQILPPAPPPVLQCKDTMFDKRWTTETWRQKCEKTLKIRQKKKHNLWYLFM